MKLPTIPVLHMGCGESLSYCFGVKSIILGNWPSVIKRNLSQKYVYQTNSYKIDINTPIKLALLSGLDTIKSLVCTTVQHWY
ncbi:hypothetical protein TI05_02610 [Achromatium sp. WMS3]|nr:hypothetical protein TI05_02610 [Achromatium sp. WMS3]